MGRQYKLVVCDQLKITVSQRRKKTPNLFLTLKCRIRVRNLTCWKRSEMRVRPELTLETELQTCNKNLFITIHLMDQTENGKQKGLTLIYLLVLIRSVDCMVLHFLGLSEGITEIILPPPPSQDTI